MTSSEWNVEFDPVLVEEAVLRSVDARPSCEQEEFHRVRDQIYRMEEPEAVEAAFNRFHGDWFARQGLGVSIFRVLGEKPLLARYSGRCVVGRARNRAEESADLRQPRQGGPLVLIKLLPATLLDNRTLLPLLRHELEHVSDMLDPVFGYQPDLPPSPDGPMLNHLLRSRYHTVWDVTIDGRLAARGVLPRAVEEFRRRLFAKAFPMLGTGLDATFDRFFHHGQPRHAELLQFACNPRTGAPPADHSGPAPPFGA